ncbi:MAG: hypothetical protein LBS84_02575 [Clostridiales bacterium]|jgi:hypothetical protein|nr:hypothetical protein [Clostridiales bacterium]
MTNNDRKQRRSSLWGTLVSIRRFDDGSSIMYFEEGGQQVNFPLRRADEPPKVPKALWEQIRQAEKEDKRNL